MSSAQNLEEVKVAGKPADKIVGVETGSTHDWREKITSLVQSSARLLTSINVTEPNEQPGRPSWWPADAGVNHLTKALWMIEREQAFNYLTSLEGTILVPVTLPLLSRIHENYERLEKGNAGTTDWSAYCFEIDTNGHLVRKKRKLEAARRFVLELALTPFVLIREAQVRHACAEAFRLVKTTPGGKVLIESREPALHALGEGATKVFLQEYEGWHSKLQLSKGVVHRAPIFKNSLARVRLTIEETRRSINGASGL